MTNTYIAPGQDCDEDIIASISEGLYAKKMGGGSVNTVTGEFNFAVAEGYLVKNGVIQEPVRGASLIGKGADILMKIDMVGKNLACGQGMCGSVSGSIPTNVGQPLIRFLKSQWEADNMDLMEFKSFYFKAEENGLKSMNFL